MGRGGAGAASGAGGANEETPLLGLAGTGRASTFKTYFNIIISIVGAGVLGLPYTFRTSGWAVSAACVTGSAILSYYCMMHLVKCREQLQKQGHRFVHTYGDLGDAAFGNWGRQFVDVMVLISQSGCCVAYMIFVGRNVASAFTGDVAQYGLVIALLFPLEVLLAWVRSLAGLAPFSIFADVCNVLAMAIVVKDDVRDVAGLDHIKALTSWSAMPFAMGVAIYCYEGFGMTLTLHSSMKKPEQFGRTLGIAFILITSLYLSFGFIGYLAYGDETQDIITLNLPNDWTTIAVKLGLSVGLFFTFPVMLYPVHEIFERKLLRSSWFQKHAGSPVLETVGCNAVRGLIVLGIACVAVMVPGFGVFISLVGSTVCAMLAFVVPALLHMQVFWDSSGPLVRAGDFALIICGVLFSIYGTYTSALQIFLPSSAKSPNTPHG
ncbi:solute carrier family 36 (proton-coupled amino acid transporter) [Marchantia polymorpha subsp. ruderalis]|uniref:Amino acid transporter transmembrane domain-containing protein n=2 Tax=Marchantia polymorpha TaxID=3197 RepID=A0A176WGU5_MARPO|nr:hypothetical protein AXG93_3017s1170 [Marchantia polymorpha subsp. ruderalis]PTQ45966.1 hypothetical protein MARPO_0013s0164 [Marchantia polymorpha]BBN18878.1 hypothetical protein Mp_8g06260 [Marchantia polymorpha subsp. ruderalis]|eukprot:PTQ45966.1 hypothetical protein MARPO_0013s0164 [Marchantia polymorpha]